MDIQQIKSNFEKKGYFFSFFDTPDSAREYLLSKISGKSVGIGGSMTVKELGLYEGLCRENDVHWHWEQGEAARIPAASAQVYICSANALSEKGDIVNIDGNGNRTSATMYGHDDVYIICGTNKLTPDFPSALHRARNIASPLNARRLGADTPCANSSSELRCYDCSSPGRICRAVAWLMAKPNGIKHMEIILIHGELGY